MADAPMTTLHKIAYKNLNDFLELINANFAMIQNSPLYKGIRGDDGDPGVRGLRGIRGSIFIFLDA